MSRLTFGLSLPVQAQSLLFAEEWEQHAGPPEMLAVAQAADRNSFDHVGVCDHVAIPRDQAPRMTTTWYDTVATLGWLAGVTENVRLLSAVYIVAYRHALQTAKAFSTLDALSGGRAVLGVGAGHLVAEFEALGVPFRERGRITDDAIRAIRAAFSDEWGSGDVGQSPRPLQPGGPPIWVGGTSPAAFRRAAELGDGWLQQGPPEQGMAAAIEELQRLRDKAGRSDRPFEIVGRTTVYVGTPDWDTGPCLSGTAGEIAGALVEQAAVGVTSIEVRFPSRSVGELMDQIDAFGDAVLPSVD